jgi:Glycosyl hydrolase catalytic core
MVGTYGVYRSYLPHVLDVMHALANGYSENFDFLNFHYYAHGGDPRLSSSDHPSFDTEWQAIHAVFPTKPIWVTEVGWTTKPLAGIQPVSPQTQATYLQYVSQEAAASAAIQRIFWFTIDYGNQPDTIYPPTGPLPAYYALQSFIMQNPLWS